MDYKKWLTEDLRDLERLRFSVTQMESELETLDAEETAIRATDYDKIPGGSGSNTQEDRLLTAIAKRDELRANLEATRRRVADLDRLVSGLDNDDELRVVQVMFLSGERNAVSRLIEELGYEAAQIYRLKDRALKHLAQMRYGAGFRP